MKVCVVSHFAELDRTVWKTKQHFARLIYNSYKAKPHYLFLLTCKASTSAVHYHLLLAISLDMQDVHLSSPLSFVIKVH
jgi:hypothetical protein